MADLEDIAETPRAGIVNDPSSEDSDSSHRKGKRSKGRRNSNRSQTLVSDPVFDEKQRVDEGEKQVVQQQTDSPKREQAPCTIQSHRAGFYGDYHKVAEEYDKEFLKKHDEDLSTTLIFAGLFSAVTAAFIVEVDSQLQADPDSETAALLRVLLYKVDNTTFGNHVPTVPQWTGPNQATVQVQAILYASLGISLFSAFLAMLGKQWLNRYESIDRRGSAIERSQNRQRKLDGINAWYFDYMMESLPLMLQGGLLLLGCALSRYLWELDTIVAAVVISITSFGAIFYIFIVIAGTISPSCPYQTPGAQTFRYLLRSMRHRLFPTLYSAFASVPTIFSTNFPRLYQNSWCCRLVPDWWSLMKRPWYCTHNLRYTFTFFPRVVFAPAHDIYCLGRVIFPLMVASSKTVYHRLMCKLKTAYTWFIGAFSIRPPDLDYQTITLDLRCISWILQTSLDKAIHLSAFKHLILMPRLVRLQSNLVIHCFNIFAGSITICDGKAVVIQGLEQLATVSADGFLRTLHHLATMDPTSRALADLQRRYNDAFPSELDFTGLPFYPTMAKIHALAGRFGNPRDIWWPNRTLTVREYPLFAQLMVKNAQEKYQQTTKVSRWMLRSALYFLSLGLLASDSVVADCLTIVAIDLGCDVSDTAILDESARVQRVSRLIIERLETMAQAVDSNPIFIKRKAINTLFPYAIYLEQSGQHGMINAIFRAARATNTASLNPTGKFMWCQVVLYISRLFEERSPTSLNRIIVLMAPFVPWDGTLSNSTAVIRWAAAASAVQYTDEIGSSVVDAIFQITWIDYLRPHIPIEIWRWMKREPPLPPICNGNFRGGSLDVTYVRRLGDIDLLKSFFVLLWTEGYFPSPTGAHSTENSIREDFAGPEREKHRRDLLDRLDNVFGWLDRKLASSPNDPLLQLSKKRFTKFRDTLLEVDTQ